MDDLDVNMAIWGIFLNATLREGVHLGHDCEANLRSYQCTETVKLGARIRAKIRTVVRRPEIIQIMF